MIKIGDFARIAAVSVATLRHYDEEGLLRPCFVHPDSGYRYYGAEQLRDIHRIFVLKSLGFSLTEVRNLMNEKPSPFEMRRLLAIKRAEAEGRLAEELAQIQRIESHIAIIEKEQSMHQLEVIRKTVPSMTIAAIRLNIPSSDQVGQLLPKAFERLNRGIATDQVTKRGPTMALWHSSPDTFVDEVVDAATPIEFAAISDPAISVLTLPETDVAAVVHTGPFSEFLQCHVALSEWLAANGYHLAGAYREIYHTCSGSNATTEVQYPIDKD